MENIFRLGDMDFSSLLRIEKVERHVMDISNTFLEVKGSPNRFLRNKAEGKEITVTATYKAPKGEDQLADLFSVVGDGSGVVLARDLYTKELTRLVLGDRPDLFDLVVIDGKVEAERFFYVSTYRMTFRSPYPWSFGEKVTKTIQGSGKITVDGNSEVYPVIHIPSLPGEKVTITNETTKDAPFRLNYTMFSGANVEVDHEAMTCRIAGETSIEKYIPLDSRWLRLVPGENTLTMTPAAAMEISFYPRYFG